MKITELSVQKKNSSRFNLYVDEAFFCGVSATGVAKYNLYKGKEITQEELDDLVIEEVYQRFLDRSVEYLSRSIKTERGVRTYLKQLKFKKKGKWFDEDIVLDWDSIFERIVKQLKKYKFLDDSRYAEAFIESRSRNRPRSTSMIVSELIGKGVDKNIALEVVNKLEVSNEDLIKGVYKKKYGMGNLDLSDRKKVDFLRRKGFNWDEISKLADDLKNDTSE